MRLPLPKNRLVALTLLGAIATAVVTVAVVTPGVLGVQTASQDTTGTASADAPQPNQGFTPAVDDGGHGEGEEHEEYEGDEDEYDDDDDDHEEYEDDDDEDEDDEDHE